MKLEYLKCIREYLKETREDLGMAGFALCRSFDPKCFYGITRSRILLSDINSVYVINTNCKKREELFFSIGNKKIRKLMNVESYINDLSNYPLSLEVVSHSFIDDILTEEQKYFYENLLQENIQSFYDEKENVLLGFGDSSYGFVSVPTLKSTNCR